MPRTALSLAILLCLCAGTASAAPRDLTFQQRVAAQEAIERVQFSHLVGATRSFEQAVPRSLLEGKVRTYLKQTQALERFWGTPVTAEALQEELDRIAAETLYPRRLEEIYAALGNDPVLVLETFARESLVERLARTYFDQGPENRPWEEWWSEVESSFDGAVTQVVRAPRALPRATDNPRLRTARRPPEQTPAPQAPPDSHCPPADSWDTSLTSAPGPQPMAKHPAVWTGNEMIVWNSEEKLGARFNPLTGSWKFLPVVEAPDRDVVVVWTGREMIVWGHVQTGNAYEGGLNIHVGVRYDPIADSWRTVSPPPKLLAPKSSVVWTGREMIVWGGDHAGPSAEGGDEFYSASGGRYDPETDSWTPTSMTGVPEARAGHATVWTGTEMIVWGGYGFEDEAPLDGGRYNPMTDTWTRISDRPQVGSGPAVWSGREMILFGHETVAYDPVRDAWRKLPTTLAPFPRTWASYTRAGDFVIVWGGLESARGKVVNTGGRYHPATDTWTPLSLVNAPSPRQGHSAVWTGDALIVWGGVTASSSLTSTGGMYFLENDLDGDGSTTCTGDCDDDNAAVHPEAVELPGNRLDENCDGTLLCDPDAEWRSPGEFVRCFAHECQRLGDACDDIPGLPTNGHACGNGVRNGREVCDASDLGGKTCESLGYDGGTLACNATCNGLDESACVSVCGNGERNTREACDGADLAGATCQSLGYDGGVLACQRSCLDFDRTSCTSFCGDGVRRGVEACDADDLAGKSCQSLGYDSGTLRCAPGCALFDTSECATLCGNGVIEPGEVCDGSHAGIAQSCHGFNDDFDGGTLGCLPGCDGYDTSACARCDDGVKAGAEACDKSDFGTVTCESLGFVGGQLTCESNCSLKTTGCMECGNNRVEGAESCDGVSFRTSCKGLGFDAGKLQCNGTCDAVDSTGCIDYTGTCGNGVKEAPEACDGLDFGDTTCASSGYDGGELLCSFDCKKISYPLCKSTCGDGIQKKTELCDGDAFAKPQDKKCKTLGYDTGNITCNSSCNGYDLSDCTKCGNNILEEGEECEVNDHGGKTCEDFEGYSNGALDCYNCRLQVNGCKHVCGDDIATIFEFCDGTDLKGRTCQSPRSDDGPGYDVGELRCTSGCALDESACSSTCGNGVRGLGEVCDGPDLGERTCGDEGFTGGALACNATCNDYDTSSCTLCGDGVREGSEVCDGADVGEWTCRLFGYSGGTLGCSSNCRTFDESACTAN